MSYPSVLEVKESLTTLKAILKQSSPMISPRIRALIEIKKAGKTGISKRELADLIGVNHNSVQTWRKAYQEGGIKALISHNKKGFKPSIFTKAEHELIEKKLIDPRNGLRGYVELLDWVENEFKKQVKYNSLLKYSMKNFGSKVKVARKSHVNKDEKAVEAFKKTSVKSVKKPVKLKAKGSKK